MHSIFSSGSGTAPLEASVQSLYSSEKNAYCYANQTSIGRKGANSLPVRFVVVSLGSKRFQTPVVKKTINPSYDGKDATFDFPIYLSLSDTINSLEIVM